MSPGPAHSSPSGAGSLESRGSENHCAPSSRHGGLTYWVRSSGVLERTLSDRKGEERSLGVSLKDLDLCALTSQEAKDGLRPGIANRQPDDLRRSAVEETELSKVVVFGDDRVGRLPGPFPDRPVCRTPQAKRANVGAPRILRFESLDEPGAQVLVEK